jgi:hypothetical protein
MDGDKRVENNYFPACKTTLGEISGCRKKVISSTVSLILHPNPFCYRH